MDTDRGADRRTGEPDRQDPAVAVVTFNRPDRRNALTVELKDALVEAVRGRRDRRRAGAWC